MAIKSLARLIQVLTAQKNNLGTYQAAVGATAGDITQVTNMLGNTTAIDTWCDQVLAYKEGAFALKDQAVYGDPALPFPAFPAAPLAPVLASPLSGGIKRQNDLNARFRAAPGYTPTAGQALEIIEPGSPPPDPSDVVPKIIVSAAKAGYGFAVIVSGRELADSWQVQVIPVASGVRTTLGTGTGKSSDFVYVPTSAEAGKPVQIRVEIQLRKNNADYGHPSAEERITVNP